MARRRKKRRVFFTGDPTGLLPGDDVGNRLKKQARQIPPDDIGNRRKDDPSDKIPPDDIGNRVEANPTHELSGILWDLDLKKGSKRRRLKVGGPQVRLGKYVVGGVNPAVAGDSQRAQEAQEAEHQRRREDRMRAREAAREEGHDDDEGGGRKRKKKSRGGYEQVDGAAAAQVNHRRAARFFDFDEDDRFTYTLKTPAEDKRRAAEECVQRILDEALRDATVTATLIEDGDRPKVLVAIDDRGPSADVPGEVRSENAEEPLFPMGSSALMSLNYLVNKIVNRYPDDRIRLAILPKDEEQTYLDALEEHKKTRKGGDAAEKADEEEAPRAEKKATEKAEPEPEEEPAEVEAGAEEEEEEAPKAKKKAVKKAAKKAAVKKEVEIVDEEDDEDEAPRAKKKTTKKAAAKKTTAKKAAAKKTTKKAAAKKTTAKKTTKKTAAKKTTAKKATRKKAAAK